MKEPFPQKIVIDREDISNKCAYNIKRHKQLNLQYLTKNEIFKLSDQPFSNDWKQCVTSLLGKFIFKS